MAVGAKNQGECNWKNVYTNFAHEIFDYNRRILKMEYEEEEKKEISKIQAIHKEMLKTNTKLDDMLEKYKDVDLLYVNDRLEEYDDLVQYYII